MDAARYLEDGKLTIFKRSGVYYARLRISPGKYVWRSLKTTDEQTAIRLGRRLLFQMEQRADQGLPPKSKSFSAVIDDYIRYRERDYQHGKTSDGMLRQIVRVSKFWRYYVLVIANSGLRPGEANDLNVRDVHPFKDEKGRSNYRFVVRGKTGERDVILRSVAAKRLDKLLAKRRAENPAGRLLAMPDGSRISTLIDQLDAALKEASLQTNSFGEKYSIYSFRHFYAVNTLRNGVGVFEVARNMGTSVQVIQEYYGKQATPAVFATRLGD